MIRYAVFVVFLLVVACSEQKKSEPFDDVKDKLIFDLFDGVEKGDHQSTFKTLARIKSIITHDPFLEQLYAKTNNNVSLIKADQALKAGDLNTAGLHAASVEDRTLHSEIQALRIIDDYLNQKPFSSSEYAYKALEGLGRTKDAFVKVESYNRWILAEKEFANELFRKEYLALLEMASKAYSKKLIASSAYSKFCLKYIDKEIVRDRDLKKVLETLCKFNPDLEIVKIDDFKEEVRKINDLSIKSLRSISNLFTSGENRKGLEKLKLFVEEGGKVSWSLQKSLLQRSEKLKRIVAGDNFILLEDVITTFEAAEEVERKLKEKAEEERRKQEEELERNLKDIRKKAESMTTD